MDTWPLPGVLSGEQLRAAITGERRLVTGWRDLDEQVQPNGFDLTLDEVSRFTGAGILPAGTDGRVQPDLTALPFGPDGFLHLPPGAYQIRFAEKVHLPNDLMALGRPRSSLNRAGVTIHSAVWDAGYAGRSTSLLAVLNPAGWQVQRGARVLQLVFLGLARPAEAGYAGLYQGEG